jgi:AraC-like DNA-binding protein
MTLTELAARWRSDAQRFREWGQEYLARTVEHAADELEETTHQHDLERLTVSQAAAETGYSESQIRRRFPGVSAIPRGLLPKKGSRQLGPDLVATRRPA